MNILFLDQYSEMGGAQHCLLDLLPAIEERGWRVHVAIPPSGPLVNKLRARGTDVEEICCGPYNAGKKIHSDFLRFAADVPKQAQIIARLFDRAEADLIYVNGPRLLPASAIAARRCRAPLFFHAHHSIRQKSAAWIEGIALRNAQAIVAACCVSVGESLKKWIPEDRLHVVPNGTTDLGFRRREFDRDRELRIGLIGRIAPDKGQTEFLRAAGILAPTIRNVRFVICGAPLWGDREYVHEVHRMAMHLPVEFIDEWRDGIGPVLADLDLLAIASSQEGMPRVLLEAFSAGVPVVAFPAGGVPEVIEDSFTGFLTRGSTAFELAGRLREIIEGQPQQLRAVAANARRAWERNYTVDAYRGRVMDVLKKTVLTKSPSAAERETAAPQPHR